MTVANDTRGSGGSRSTAATVFLAIGTAIGVLIALGGIALLVAFAFLRDDGYFTTDTERLASPGYAIASDAIDLGRDSVDVDPGDVGAKLEITATSVRQAPVFVGIGPRAAVAKYLRDVAHSRLDDFGGGRPDYTQIAGPRRPASPLSQGFWVARSAGRGEQRMQWDVDAGTWTAVVMNADGSRAVAVDADAGVKIDWLIWVGVGLTVLGLVIAGSCGYGLAQQSRKSAPSAPPGTPPAPPRT